MKIKSTFNGLVMTKKETVSKDGNKKYYDLGLVVGDDLGNINCTEDAYKDAVKGEEMTMIAVYDSEYKYMRITCCTPFTQGKVSSTAVK